jgi:hypothetical protein
MRSPQVRAAAPARARRGRRAASDAGWPAEPRAWQPAHHALPGSRGARRLAPHPAAGRAPRLAARAAAAVPRVAPRLGRLGRRARLLGRRAAAEGRVRLQPQGHHHHRRRPHRPGLRDVLRPAGRGHGGGHGGQLGAADHLHGHLRGVGRLLRLQGLHQGGVRRNPRRVVQPGAGPARHLLPPQPLAAGCAGPTAGAALGGGGGVRCLQARVAWLC